MRTLPEVFVLLLAAHCYGDFLLQTRGMAENKHRWGPLAAHCGVHVLVAYIVLQQWGAWQIPVLLFILHGLIDRGKACLSPTPRAFAMDQLAHVVSLVFVAWCATGAGWISGEGFPVAARNWIVAG